MDSSFGNGSPRANTSPQDIDLLHEIAPGLDYSNMVTNPILWLVAKKNISPLKISGKIPTSDKLKSINTNKTNRES